MRAWSVLFLLTLLGCSPVSEQPTAVVAPTSAPVKLLRPTPTGPAPTVPTTTPSALPIITPTRLTPIDNTTLQEMRALQASDPAADLEQSRQRGDYRFAAIHQNGLFVPGVKNDTVPSIVKQYGVKVICEIPDQNPTNEQEQLWQVARSYAGRYNGLLLIRLKGG